MQFKKYKYIKNKILNNKINIKIKQLKYSFFINI